MKKTYTVKQVADILGYSTNSIYTFLKEKRIEGVRIGKGRFRISQEELEKLLHLKKTGNDYLTSSVSGVNLEQQTNIENSTILREKIIPTLDKHTEKIKENIPNLFDWFISLISIVLGFTMILFVRNFEEFSGTTFSQYLLPIKINLLAAGLGLFIVNFIGRTRKKWYLVFYIVILINFIVYGLILLLGKDFFGSSFFLITSLIIILQLTMNLRGTVSFNILMSILTISSPLALILFPNIFELSELVKVTGLTSNVILLIWLIVVFVSNTIIWLPKKETKIMYWISFLIISLGFSYFSYLLSIQLYWSKALIYLLIALFALISSFWNEINQIDKENRRIIKNVFCDLVLIFIIFISIIWTNQSNVRSFTQDELINKLITGESLVKLNIDSSKEKLETSTKDKLFVNLIKKGDQKNLKDSIKNIFILSKNFRRVLVADANGDILNVYPETDVSYTNISFHDYFRNVKDSKKSYLSNLFQSEVNDIKRYVITINTPILDENNNFIGIVIGTLDIDSISNRLKQISNDNSKEYFIVIDEQGNTIFQTEEVNRLSREEFVQLKTGEDNHPEEVLNFEKKLLQVHKKIRNSNWIITIRKPLINVYDFNSNVNFLFYLIILGMSILMIFLNLTHLNR